MNKIVYIVFALILNISIYSCAEKKSRKADNNTTADSVNVKGNSLDAEDDTLSTKARIFKKHWQALIDSQSVEEESKNADILRESCMRFGTFAAEVKDKEGVITKHFLTKPLPEDMTGVRLILFEDGGHEFRTSFWNPKDTYSFYRLFLE